MSEKSLLQKFIHHMGNYVELNEGDIHLIYDCIPIQRFGKGENLLEEGKISNAFFYVLKGFVRLFYLQEGEEKTTYFYPEGTFVSAYSSFMRQQPASFYFQATEETTVAVIGLEASQKLLAHSPKFETLARTAMEEEMISLQEIIASLLTLSPEQRYAELLQKNPEIFQKVPQIQIASFIGVKPESLSRIKKRFMERS